MHVALRVLDLTHSNVDVVLEKLHCFLVLVIHLELDGHCVLVSGDLRPSIGLGHRVVILLDEVEVGDVNGVWVPGVSVLDHELLGHLVH